MTNRFHTESLMKSVSHFPVSKGGSGSGRYPKGSGSSEMPDTSVIESALDRAEELSNTIGGTLENYVEPAIDDVEGNISNMESAASDFAESAGDSEARQYAQDNWDSSLGEASDTASDVQGHFEQLDRDAPSDMGVAIDDIILGFDAAGISYDEVEGALSAIEDARSAVDNFQSAVGFGVSYAKGFSEILSEYTPETVDGWGDVGDFDGARESLNDAQSALEYFNNALYDIRSAVEGIEAQASENNRTSFLGGRDDAIREALADDDHSTASALHRELADAHNAYEGDAEISASVAHKQAAELHEAADAIRQSSGKGNTAYKVLANQADKASRDALLASNQTF